MPLGRGRLRFTRLLEVYQGSLSRQAAQRIDQHCIGFGYVETNVGNVVGRQSLQNREDGGLNDVDTDRGSESLFLLAS